MADLVGNAPAKEAVGGSPGGELVDGQAYPAIFTKTAQSQPGESNNVFVQLGMYWQLHLAYDGAKGDGRCG